ncbi:hypothetical protein MNBD_PLANCTO02-2640, partial [hydrothermal vent metagenome]
RKHFTPINGSSSEDNSIVKKSTPNTPNTPTPNTPTPPSKASSNSTPNLYADDLVRQEVVSLKAETTQKLNLIHREIMEDIAELERILISEKNIPLPVKASFLRCAYYYYGAALDDELRKKLTEFQKKYGS